MAYQSNYTGSQIDAGIQKTTKMTVDGNNVTFAGKVTVTDEPTGDMDVVNKGYLSNISGITDEIKQALLNCFQKVAWIDGQGQTYYDALYDALYPPVGLDSITCVYTQSGTVYDTDSLDSLKSDLVVTAHYDDQSTETVTTYTLSGSLTTGTSTITVMYGGKSTTFNVTVTHDESADWDYIWNYTDGLPPVSDWNYTTSGGGGQIHTIVDDGMLLAAKTGTSANYSMPYAPSQVSSANGGIIEFTFYIPSDGAVTNLTNARYFSGCISDGTTGLRVDFAHPKNSNGALNIILFNNSSVWSGSVLGTWNYDAEYKLRLEIDLANNLGQVYVNDVLVAEDVDLSTIYYGTNVSMSTNGVTVDSTAKGFVVSSVKVKYGLE